MAQGDPTLWQVLTDNDALPDAAVVTLEGDSGMAGVREQLLRVSAPEFAATVRDSLLESVKGVLATPLEDILGNALGTYRELLKYCDKTRHPPEEICVVPLSSRTIQSTHQPHVDILIDGVPKGKIDFEARIALTIEAVTLKIRDGKIWEIKTGACKAEGSLRCGSAVLAEKKMRPIALPGTVTFASGVPIAPQ